MTYISEKRLVNSALVSSFSRLECIHSYVTRLVGRLGLTSPAADQRPAAAPREAAPNFDGSECVFVGGWEGLCCVGW